MSKLFTSELRIIFENCVTGSNTWINVENEIVEQLRLIIKDILDIEFEGLHISKVRGDRVAHTIAFSGVFYNTLNKLSYIQLEQLKETVKLKLVGFYDFSFNQLKINHIRTLSNFPEWNLNHIGVNYGQSS